MKTNNVAGLAIRAAEPEPEARHFTWSRSSDHNLGVRAQFKI